MSSHFLMMYLAVNQIAEILHFEINLVSKIKARTLKYKKKLMKVAT